MNMKKDNRAFQSYIAADPRYYESMDRYPYSKADFHAPTEARLGSGWNVIRKGVWLHCKPDAARLQLQGWKIHLSARRKDAEEILKRAADVLVPRGVSFKFLLDKTVLTMTNSKSWGRGGAGKFITVYPADNKEFLELLEALGKATSEFSGPYILSDKRYKEYKVVYYRYGGIKLNTVLETDGQKTPVLVSPSGEKVPDVRHPYFSLPAWVEDLFKSEKSGGKGLNNGRYKVESSLGFSNSGGVYLAVDGQSGQKVVVKEARPWINESAPEHDMVSLLGKEHRVLEKIKDLGIAPGPVEFFREWEHTFLVQEYLDKYISLDKWAVRNDIVLHARFTYTEAREFFLKYIDIFRKLAGIIEKLHGRGIIFGDFSANNVMLNPDSLDVKIIDFEGARESGAASPAWFFTPGFSDPARPRGKELSFEDDYYAFGANMLYALVRVNQMAGLNPGISGKWLDCLVTEFGFPPELRPVILGLMHPDPAARIKPAEAVRTLETAVKAMREGREIMPLRVEPKGAGYYGGLAAQIVSHLESVADYSRKDRLWPALPEVFETNPLSMAYGAAGVLKGLKNAAPEKISRQMLDWVLNKDIQAENYPPGLHVGMSGIAWALLDLGLKKEAAEVLEKTTGHPLLYSAPDMYNGTAGWGMTNLRFWLESGDAKYLNMAVEAGKKIIASASAENGGMCWKISGKSTPVGFAFGASGISVFLACLSKAAGSAEFGEAAEKALRFDLKHEFSTPDGGLAWPANTSPDGPIYFYLESGSAGIGMACLRLWKLTGKKEYSDLVEKIYIACDRIYTVYPGRSNGLAGIGEFLLDAYRFTGEKKYIEAARKVAAGIEKFGVKVERGLAFPGNGLLRLSCDYASGSAGIASFFHRLESGGAADFMLDELF